MANAHYLQNKDGEKFYPYGHTNAVFSPNGTKLETRLNNLENNSHFHENEEVLNEIDSDDIVSWDSAVQSIQTISNDLNELEDKVAFISNDNENIGDVNTNLTTADIVDNLNSSIGTMALSAKQGKVLNERINNMQTLPEGSTTADAALYDINIGYDGKDWKSPGEAVRGQVSQLSSENACKNKILSDILECDMANIEVEKGGISFDGTLNDLKYFNRTNYLRVKAGTNITMAENWQVGVFYYDDEKNLIEKSLNESGTSTLVSSHTITKDCYVRLVFRYLDMDITQEELNTNLWVSNTIITVPPYSEYKQEWNSIPFSVRNISLASDYLIYKQEGNTLRSIVFQIKKGETYKVKVHYASHCRIGLVSEIKYGQKVETIIEDTRNIYDKYETVFTNNTDYNYAIVFIFIDVPNSIFNVSKVQVEELRHEENTNDFYFRPKELLNGIRTDITNGLNVDGDISWTADQIIENIYEPLRVAFPDYVTRENIGKDASGKYNMWCYIFGHEYYDKTVYIQGGVHSAETEGYWAVARFCQLLCNDHEKYKEIEKLYQTTRFVVVPIVNVWGVSEKPQYIEGSYGYNSNTWWASTNSNEVNLNRDGENKSQQETINIHNNFNKYLDNLVLAIDSHTTTMKSWGDYLFICEGTDKEITPMLRTNNYLLHKNVKDRDTNNVFMGLSKDYPIGYPNTTSYGINGSFIQYFNSKGVKSLTTEYSDYVFDYTIGTDISITRATENLVNQIIQNVNII
jgi:hypothetical protein